MINLRVAGNNTILNCVVVSNITTQLNRVYYSERTFSLFDPNNINKRHQENKNNVLEALASTVKPIAPPLLFGKSIADTLFSRFDRDHFLKLTMCAEAGKKAAERIISMHPELFPGFNSAPNLGDVPVRPEIPKEACLEKLIYYLDNRVAQEAYDCYTDMCAQGSERPSIDIMNRLIDLIGVRGIGNIKDTSRQFIHDDISKIPEKDMEEMINISKDPEKMKENYLNSIHFAAKRIWLPDNPSEILFRELVEKGTANRGTYEALLSGLFKHEYSTRYISIFNEMLQKGFQPSLRSYNNLFQLYNFYHKHLNLANDELISKLNFYISQMNQSPVVSPCETTFDHLLSLSIIVRKDNKNETYFPHFMLIFREMVYTHRLKIKLSHLAKIISPKENYLHEVSDFIKKNQNILFQLEIPSDLNFVPILLRFAIKLELPDLIEYYYHINKCMNFIGEKVNVKSFKSSAELYLEYKFNQLSKSDDEGAAQKIFDIFREQRLLFRRLESTLIEQVITFLLNNKKFDLYMKCVQGFLSTALFKTEMETISKVLEQFEIFITGVSESNDTDADIYSQAIQLTWSITGLLESEKGQSYLLKKFLSSALKLLTPIEPNKARNILSWMSRNSKKSIHPIYYRKLFESYLKQRNIPELKLSLDTVIKDGVIIDNDIFTRVADFINLNDQQRRFYYSKLVEGNKENFRFSLPEYFNNLDNLIVN